MVQIIDLTKLQDRSASAEADRASLPAEIWATNDIRDFADFWPRSDRIGAARCFAFQTADVLELVCDAFSAALAIEPLFVAIVNERKEPLALVPLGIRRRRGIRILGFLDGGMSDYNAPVLFEPTRDWSIETFRLAWRGIQKIQPSFDVAILEKMPDRVYDLPNPFHRLSTSPYSTSGHAMTLSGTWSDLSAKLPNRTTMRKAENRLRKLGAPKFDVVRTPEQYDLVIEALMRQKSQRYMETWGVDGLDRPGYRQFLRTAKRLLYPAGPVRLFSLQVNDTILSTNWGYIVDAKYFGLMTAFTGGEWSRYSPGRYLFHKVIEWCVENGIEILDFGIGNEEYKEGYCDSSLSLYRAEIALTFYGRMFIALRNAKIAFAKFKKNIVDYCATRLRGSNASGIPGSLNDSTQSAN
jgi:CelD/BcsL family acetyltransferase involved in cellulose biosynthesis